MIRVFDIFISLIGLIILSPILLLLSLFGWIALGSPIFVQDRVGHQRKVFQLVKFRTMRMGTAGVPTHLADPAAVTPYGRRLRRSKLDELPQLWNVLVGDMSLVGPRPCLPSQVDLIQAREALGVYSVRPGITGLAQVQGVDMSDPIKLSELDAELIRTLTVWGFFKYLILTVTGHGGGDAIRFGKK